MTIDPAGFSLEAWRHADRDVRRARAAMIADALGGAIDDGDDGDDAPVIVVDGVRLAIIPGGAVTLGWDAARMPALTDAQRDELAAYAAETDTTLEESLAYYLAPTRAVVIAPFLLEVAPRSIRAWADELDDEDLLAAIAARVASEGWRLPTDDEWEHAARGGTASFFRWGDAWPDGIPYGGGTTFTGHRAPNGYGLRLLDDPYQVEVVAAPLGFRAGDGGSAVCGGQRDAWMTFASAYRAPRDLWEDVVVETLEQGWIRRARDLP